VVWSKSPVVSSNRSGVKKELKRILETIAR